MYLLHTHINTYIRIYFKLGFRNDLVSALMELVHPTLFWGVRKIILDRKQQHAGLDTLHNLVAGEKWQNIALVKVIKGQVHSTALVRR